LRRVNLDDGQGSSAIADAHEHLTGGTGRPSDDLLRRHGIACRIGVGGSAASVSGLHDSYRDATTSLYLAERLRRSSRRRARCTSHRNTLVYRLNKIESVLGPAFRDPQTCLSVYLACLIDELEESTPG
jgi:DNA-binding PucR family transcriptional regulator